MATSKEQVATKLTARVEVGVTDSGKTKYGDRTLSGINPEITDDNARVVAEGYAELQNYPLSAVKRTDTSTLIEE